MSDFPEKPPLASLHILTLPDGSMAIGRCQETSQGTTAWTVFVPALHVPGPADLRQHGLSYVREVHAMRRLVGDPEPNLDMISPAGIVVHGRR